MTRLQLRRIVGPHGYSQTSGGAHLAARIGDSVVVGQRSRLFRA
jgi:hypothetical protein